jgi:quinol-cytochrome oxidoreductase complex cytochrome b subunit
MVMSDDLNNPNLNDRQRAFKRYKAGVASHGKPFFPDAVKHDLVSATIVMLIILLLSVVWWSKAGCGEYFKISCHTVQTPKQQEANKSFLGPLYEDKADPGTTKYHPRPEWYFYFLFDLLRIFTQNNLVVMGTIGLPTIWLLLLMAWPFIDRKRERRPSRRPVAMVAMVVTGASLLGLTWHGSKSPSEGGLPKTLTAAQAKMPGAKLIFDDPRATCSGCHKFEGAWTGSIGPELTNEGKNNRGVEWQIKHLKDPQSETKGSTMPAQSPAYKDDEIKEIAEFLESRK